MRSHPSILVASEVSFDNRAAYLRSMHVTLLLILLGYWLLDGTIMLLNFQTHMKMMSVVKPIGLLAMMMTSLLQEFEVQTLCIPKNMLTVHSNILF